MEARRQLLAAAAALEPLRQGELDGLCGIYAVINWIQLGLYARITLTPGERKWLFEHGVKFIAQTRHLPSVITSGMSSALWKRLARSMLDETGTLTGLNLRAEPIITIAKPTAIQLQRAMAAHIDLGQPIILTLWGRYDHTTVAYGWSEHRLRLFDSFGFKWITMRYIDVFGGGEPTRHMVKPAMTWALQVAAPIQR